MRSCYALKFVLLSCENVCCIGVEPRDETGVKESSLPAVETWIGHLCEEKSRFAVTGRWIGAELNATNRIDLPGNRDGIAPVIDASRKRIVDAEDFWPMVILY